MSDKENTEVKIGPMRITPKTFEEWIHSLPVGAKIEIAAISNGALLKCITTNEAYLLNKD